MNSALLDGRTASSTTRISTDFEKMWRDQFLAQQERTPAESFADLEVVEPQGELRRVASTVRFAGGAYDPTIIKFYEDIIAELQREVERYRALWHAARAAAESEPVEQYAERDAVAPSPAFARKLKRSAKPSLRFAAE